MAAQRSLEPLILVRIRAPLPVFMMKSYPEDDPPLPCKIWSCYRRLRLPSPGMAVGAFGGRLTLMESICALNL